MKNRNEQQKINSVQLSDLIRTKIDNFGRGRVCFLREFQCFLFEEIRDRGHDTRSVCLYVLDKN